MSVEFYRGSSGKFDSRTLNRKTRNRWTGCAHVTHALLHQRIMQKRAASADEENLNEDETYTYIYIYNILIYIYIYICIHTHTVIHNFKSQIEPWIGSVNIRPWAE